MATSSGLRCTTVGHVTPHSWTVFAVTVIMVLAVVRVICHFHYKAYDIDTREPVRPAAALPEKGVESDLTIVTAYFDLGRFPKITTRFMYYSPKSYHEWAKKFKELVNPMVLYTDSDEFADLMTSLRSEYPSRTKIIRTHKNTSWAFSLEKKIRKLYSRKDYPKHLPNSVTPGYPCAQHAKYDVTARAIRRNYFHTKYFAWVDIGYFRDRAAHKGRFTLIPPPAFNDSRLAVTEVNQRNTSVKTEEIIRETIVWVGGGLFLGKGDVILEYAKTYRKAVNHFLDNDLMNTDEQIIYAMYSKEGRQLFHPRVELQPYGHGKGGLFYLGYLMLQEV